VLVATSVGALSHHRRHAACWRGGTGARLIACRETDIAASKTASDKVGRAVHEQKRGTLKTGSGKKVTSKKQAVAIGLSEARKKGAKVPAKRHS
jgi:hypothetical protein